MTKIIATHDLELAVELCQRAMVLDEGKVIADGPATTILSDEDLMLAQGLEKNPYPETRASSLSGASSLIK